MTQRVVSTLEKRKWRANKSRRTTYKQRESRVGPTNMFGLKENMFVFSLRFERLLRERSSASRFESFPKEDGMLPIRRLFDKLRKTRPFKSPMTCGISSLILLLEISMAILSCKFFEGSCKP